jgi:hypothetical protein
LQFKVSGKVAPETVNPLPVTVAEFMITGAVPVEVNVTNCVVGEFVSTLPKLKLELLTLNVGTNAPSCRTNVWAASFALAVSVTGCEELTDETVAEKPALTAPTGTVIELGTVTTLLLLEKLTAKPPAAAGTFTVTVQLSVPAPVIEPLAQLSAVSTVVADPLEPIEEEGLFDGLIIDPPHADSIVSKKKRRATETAFILPFPRLLVPLKQRGFQKLS